MEESSANSTTTSPSTQDESPMHDIESPSQSEIESKRRSAPFHPNLRSALIGKPDYTNIQEIFNETEQSEKQEDKKVILIRHASTIQNQRAEKLLDLGQTTVTTMGQWIDLQSDSQLIDTQLSPEGIQQCLIAGENIVHHKFDVVFVSPMIRCLQTAYYIFSQNTSFMTIKFIIHPFLREKMHVSADLMQNYDLNQQIPWMDKFPNIEFFTSKEGSNPSSLYKDEKWILESLDGESQMMIKTKMSKIDGGTFSDAFNSACIDLMQEIYPKSIESLDSSRARSDIVKSDIKSYLKRNPGLTNIGLVGHNVFFRVLTTKPEFWERTKDEKIPSKMMPDAPDCMSLKNCEFVLFQL